MSDTQEKQIKPYDGHPGGRPPKWESVEQLEKLLNDYFALCDESKRPYTVTGLALALDTNRQTLVNYEKKDEFFDTIKRAKMKCENYAEEELFRTSQVAGIIFNLKNNYGWKDAQQIDLKNTKLDDLLDAFEKP